MTPSPGTMRAGLQAKGPLYGQGYKTQIPPRFESALCPGPTIKTSEDAPPSSLPRTPRPLPRPVSELPVTSAPLGFSGKGGTGGRQREGGVWKTIPGVPPGKGGQAGGSESKVGGRRRELGGAAGGTDGGAGRGVPAARRHGRDSAAPRGARGRRRGAGAAGRAAPLSHAEQRRGRGARRGRGLSPRGRPLRLFASLLIPGREPRSSCGPRRAEAGGEGAAAARRPGHRAPAPPALSGRAARARAEEAEVCRPPRRGPRGSPRFPVLFANFAPLLRAPPLRRPGGHGRGPERGRAAGAGSPRARAAAVSGADLRARAPRPPPCRARARACGWPCR